MRKKMFLVFFIILVFVFVMIGRIFAIEMRSGEKYEKIVLSQQEYNSQTIPFRRGDILDRKGTILATSTDVYNVVLDCTVVNAKKENVDPTVEALVKYLGLKEEDIRKELKENPDSRYSVLAKRLPYSKVKDLEAVIEDDSSKNKVKGIWLEKEYVRDYPYNTGKFASGIYHIRKCGNRRH